jgi:flagellar capping protein FliD
MPVTVSCALCGTKIKDVSPDQFKDLTGREVCRTCADKIDERLKEIDLAIKQYKEDISKLNENGKKMYDQMQKAYAKFNADAVSLYKTMVAEFNAMKESIINAE